MWVDLALEGAKVGLLEAMMIYSYDHRETFRAKGMNTNWVYRSVLKTLRVQLALRAFLHRCQCSFLWYVGMLVVG